MTHYVQIVRVGDSFVPKDWTPWRRCKSVQETANLAAHKFMRESGYASCNGDFEPFDVMIYVATDADVRCPDRGFLTCHGFKMHCSPAPRG